MTLADAYIGEIRIFSGNFAPKGWALCNGQLMSINQNTALFSILGVQYGGDGKSTFALPNLMGSAVIHQGSGTGLTPRTVGEKVGDATVTLNQTGIPAHTHTPQGIVATGNQTSPKDAYWAQAAKPIPTAPQPPLYNNAPSTDMTPMAVGVTGSSQPHNNMQPFITQTFIICLQGEFPSRG